MAFGFLKGGVAALQGAAARFQGKEFMEGVVGAALMVAHADGDLEPAEKSKIFKVMTNLDALKAFDAADIKKVFDKGVAQYDIDIEIGNQWSMKQIREGVAGDSDGEKANTMIAIAMAVAKADGELEDAEKKVIAQIREELGL